MEQVSKYNIEAFVDQSEPNAGFAADIPIELSSWQSSVFTPLLAVDDTNAAYYGIDSETPGVTGGGAGASTAQLPVIAFKGQAGTTSIIRTSFSIPRELACGLNVGLRKPYIALGVRTRFVSPSGASQATLRLVATMAWNHPGSNTRGTQAVNGDLFTAAGVAVGTRSAYAWQWFDFTGAMDAAELLTVLNGGTMEFQLRPNETITPVVADTDPAIQIVSTALAIRKHLTIRDKTARNYRSLI